MPIITVPVLLGSAAAASALFGGKKTYDGVASIRRARAIRDVAKARHQRHVELVDMARAQLTHQIVALEEERLEARAIVETIVEYLRAIGNEARQQLAASLDAVGVDVNELPERTFQFFEPRSDVRNLAAVAGASTAASGAATFVATHFGIASTGTAISGLSGAAANSAMLAWLGGGSLASGGGGMALGSIVLSGVSVGPAVALGGLVLAKKGAKAETQATLSEADVNRAIGELDVLIAFSRQVERRAEELRSVTHEVGRRAAARIALLPDAAEFTPENDKHVSSFQRSVMLAKTLSELCQVQVVDEDGNLGDEVTGVLAAGYELLAVEEDG